MSEKKRLSKIAGVLDNENIDVIKRAIAAVRARSRERIENIFTEN